MATILTFPIWCVLPARLLGWHPEWIRRSP